MQKFYNIFKGDKVIWMIFFFLCIVSIIEVFSASSFLTYKGGSYWGPMIKHTFFILMGIGAMVMVLNVPCRFFKIVTPFLLFLSVILLIVVLIIGESTNGASRWIPLGLFNFQPSELAKGTLVLATAQILSAMQTEKGADKNAFWYVIVTSLFIILPIFIENFSTAMLLAVVIFMMMFVGRVPLSQLGKLLGIGIIGASLGLAALMAIPEPTEETVNNGQTLEETTAKVEEPKEKKGGLMHRALTWKHRIQKAFNNERPEPEKYDLDKDAQVAHANIAIINSNVIGRGPGNSEERDFLSQAFSDFIFAIIIEESGIVGAVIVTGLYIIIFFRAGKIANKCENNFPAFLAMGIGMLLVVQALFNMCVAVGLAPVTGQPLPLISRGGTSTIINCVYIGVLLSISKSAKRKQPKGTVVKVEAVQKPKIPTISHK